VPRLLYKVVDVDAVHAGAECGIPYWLEPRGMLPPFGQVPRAGAGFGADEAVGARMCSLDDRFQIRRGKLVVGRPELDCWKIEEFNDFIDLPWSLIGLRGELQTGSVRQRSRDSPVAIPIKIVNGSFHVLFEAGGLFIAADCAPGQDWHPSDKII